MIKKKGTSYCLCSQPVGGFVVYIEILSNHWTFLNTGPINHISAESWNLHLISKWLFLMSSNKKYNNESLQHDETFIKVKSIIDSHNNTQIIL